MRIVQPSEVDPSIRIANYFSVKPKSDWGPRKISEIELIYIVSGHFSYEQPGADAVQLGSGDVLCILPERLHTFRFVGKEGVISCIHCELLPIGCWAGEDYRLQPFPQLTTKTGGDERLHALFHQCAEVFTGYAPYRDALLQTMLREIWLRLAAYWEAPVRMPYSKRMVAMVTYLRDNLHRPISRLELAEAFAITPQHVDALFRKELAMSPTQFLHRERILQAYRYLQIDGMSINEAAARVGFQDVSYFSRVFKKVTGMRPGQVR